METIIYNKEGKESGNIKLPEKIFGLPWNADLMHQIMISYASNKRSGTAHTKDRSEVRGGGKKPWKQKGTGRARHGSRRSPIWIGGGTTHGPGSERNYDRAINKKMRRKALYTALSQKLRDGELVFVDSLSFAEPKTKDGAIAFTSIAKSAGLAKIEKGKRITTNIFVYNLDANTEKSFRNLANTEINDARNMNPYDIMQRQYLIISNPEETVAFLQSKF